MNTWFVKVRKTEWNERAVETDTVESDSLTYDSNVGALIFTKGSGIHVMYAPGRWLEVVKKGQ